jgi:hypothetical protein
MLAAGERRRAARVIYDEPELSEFFLAYLSRNIRIEEDLVDQLFNSSEKRLARRSLCPHASRIKFTTGDGARARGQKIAIVNADPVEYFWA